MSMTVASICRKEKNPKILIFCLISHILQRVLFFFFFCFFLKQNWNISNSFRLANQTPKKQMAVNFFKTQTNKSRQHCWHAGKKQDQKSKPSSQANKKSIMRTKSQQRVWSQTNVNTIYTNILQRKRCFLTNLTIFSRMLIKNKMHVQKLELISD